MFTAEYTVLENDLGKVLASAANIGRDVPPGENEVKVTDKEPEGDRLTDTYQDGADDIVVFSDQTYTVSEGGDTPAFKGTPTRSGYVFAGWTPDVAAAVTAEAVYTARWAEDQWTDPKNDHNGADPGGIPAASLSRRPPPPQV